MENLFLKSIAIGLSIAAPVGPIGTLCITRSIQQGQAVGLATGFGAATADAVYGVLAAFGLAVIVNFLVAQQSLLTILGGGFLWYLAYKTYRASSQKTSEHAVIQLSLLSAYVSTFLLTLTNPMTILSFIAVFAALGANPGNGSLSQAVLVVAGVFTGSALWWLILSAVSAWIGRRISSSFLSWINVFSAAILAVFGSIALYTGVVGA